MSSPGRNENRDSVQPAAQYARETCKASSPLKRHPQPAHHTSSKLASSYGSDRAFVCESIGESRPAPEAAPVHGNARARNAAGRSSYAARWMSSLDAAMRSLDVAADRTSHALQSRLAPVARLPQQPPAGSRAAHSSASDSAAPSRMADQRHAGSPQEHAGNRAHTSIPALRPASSAASATAQGNTRRGSSEGARAETSRSHTAKLHLQEHRQPSAPTVAMVRTGAAASASGQGYLNHHPQPSAHMPSDENAGSAAASASASGQAHLQQQQQHMGNCCPQNDTEMRRHRDLSGLALSQRQQPRVDPHPDEDNTQHPADGRGFEKGRIANNTTLHLSGSPTLDLPQAGHAAQHQAELQPQDPAFSGATPQPHHRPCVGESPESMEPLLVTIQTTGRKHPIKSRETCHLG